jgi:hypothetical protein
MLIAQRIVDLQSVLLDRARCRRHLLARLHTFNGRSRCRSPITCSPTVGLAAMSSGFSTPGTSRRLAARRRALAGSSLLGSTRLRF